jgi:GNAT superfamily N-acetyltransferase
VLALTATSYSYGHCDSVIAVSDALQIARAVPGEYPPILALHREAGWPGTHVDGEVWVMREAGGIAGSVQLLELAPCLLLIDAAVVRADARGRGLGTQLLGAVLATRTADWWLECREERIAFYERLGFRVAPADAVPEPVAVRIGGNATRRQFFLHRAATVSP